ncbi:MAG: hypothetical protein WC047_02080 [Kiritimatiellales bacterium]
MKNIIILLSLLFVITGCAGLNPNPGERTADNSWTYGNYERAHAILRPCAERGEPWAQLRLGVAYQFGNGVETNINEAVKWYTKAALQEKDGLWANGYIVGAFGKAGYFSQNIDALLAQHYLATIYLSHNDIPPDLVKAYLLESNVSKESNGEWLYFYALPNGQPMGTSAEDISNTLAEIEKKMSPAQKMEAQEKLSTWSIKKILQPIK